MNVWIVASNDNIYRIALSLKENKGMVDWRQDKSVKFSIGDIVFIYKPQPENKIRYRMEVVGVDINDTDTIMKNTYWKDKYTYYAGLGSYSFVRFKIIEEYKDDRYNLSTLKEHGLSSDIVGTYKPSELLSDYLLHPDVNYDTDYPEEDDDLYEGALVKVRANKYERNHEARQKCLEAKGYKCSVCEMDFEEVYGKIGHHFIEVHHVVPISSIGKSYKIDEIRDLVPVCSNCHSMLHQKPGKYEVYTIDELKEMISDSDKSTAIPIGIISNVEDYPSICSLINSMLDIGKYSELEITKECINNFGEFFPFMKATHWIQCIHTYINKSESSSHIGIAAEDIKDI